MRNDRNKEKRFSYRAQGRRGKEGLVVCFVSKAKDENWREETNPQNSEEYAGKEREGKEGEKRKTVSAIYSNMKKLSVHSYVMINGLG